tara:strand:- start:1741 stop:2136 length:396 start_codon:yes stop_codon:yes gene_type:complete
MDKQSVLKAFNNQFVELWEDLENCFPEYNDVKVAKTALFFLKKSNPRILISVWYRYIHLKYGEEIAKDNVSYFLEKDYSADFKKMDEKTHSDVLKGIDKIRKPLGELDEENQKVCLQYLKNLNQLSNIYYN